MNYQSAIATTDTVWGLIAKPSEANVEKIYQLKGRDRNKALIIFAKSIDTLKELSEGWDPVIEELAAKHWPGELTIVMKRSAKLPEWLNPGLETIGMRIPNSPTVSSLFGEEKFLLSTSANLSGQKPVANYQEALEQFEGKVDLILERDESTGEASTIISYLDGEISVLRQGALELSS
ncbi:MAG: L-threonylcarbamoyladenylate synthase [Candidatus Melainabacteria bacterium]|nr:L-threonylcarbamoyladenylate synthase [Candidatus Melainabacteria bacterium]